jgi:YVTN family beta-propeller protein
MFPHFSVHRYAAGLAVGALLSSVFAVVAAVPATAAGGSGRAYVTNFAADTVSVIDVVSQTVVDTIAVGDGPQGIAVNSAGDAAYVVNQNADTVSVLNLDTDTVSATITLTAGATPSYDVLNPSGTRLYVTNQGSSIGGTVFVIDTTTNTVVTSIGLSVATQAYGLAINAAGTVLYVAIANARAVLVINTLLNLPTGVVTVGSIPTDVALNPAANEAYVPNNGGSSVSVFDTTTNLPVATISTQFGPYFADFDAAGTRAYVTQSVGTVSVIDTASRSVLTTVHVMGDPWTPKVDPGNTYVYVVNNQRNSVQLIRMSDNTVANEITGLSQPRDIAFGPAA